jgi:lipopolysaccharide transport system ATP-binding protein
LFTLPLLPNGDYALTTSVAGGDLLDNVHHNWLHDALIIHISSSAVRYGLVGIPFDDVRMRLCN